jgi:hypothetical protein
MQTEMNLLFLLIVNLAASVFLLPHAFVFGGASYSENRAFDFTGTTSRTLCIGTNDKDTYTRIIPA